MFCLAQVRRNNVKLETRLPIVQKKSLPHILLLRGHNANNEESSLKFSFVLLFLALSFFGGQALCALQNTPVKPNNLFGPSRTLEQMQQDSYGVRLSLSQQGEAQRYFSNWANILQQGYNKGLRSIKERQNGLSMQYLTLKKRTPWREAMGQKTWLSLSFHQPPKRLEDSSNNFQIQDARFFLVKPNNGHLPHSHAGFFSEGGVDLIAHRNALDPQKALFERSFLLSMDLYPRRLRGFYQLLNYERFRSQHTSRFLVEMIQGYIRLKIKRFPFWGGELSSQLSSTLPLKKNQWNRLSISYNHINKELSLWINGKRNRVFSLEKKEEDAAISAKATTSEPKIQIGSNYHGLISHVLWLSSSEKPIHHHLSGSPRRLGVKLLHRYLPYPFADYSPQRDRFSPGKALYQSPVVDLREYGTRLENLLLKLRSRNGEQEKVYRFPIRRSQGIKAPTFARLQLRMSNRYFQAQTSHKRIPWQELTLKKAQEEAQEKKLAGRYLQWRLILFAGAQGREAPKVEQLSLKLAAPKGLVGPTGLQVTQVTAKSVRLEWNQGNDPRIDGYRIYYGLRPNKAQGFIQWSKGQNLTNIDTNGNSLSMLITNDLIRQSKMRLSQDKGPYFTFSPLQPFRQYFFHIVAFRKVAGGVSQKNLIFSPKSSTITARLLP